MNKSFNVKIYDKEAEFLKNLDPEIVESEIAFTQQINGGQGELMLNLAIPFDNLPSYISAFNFVRVYEVDESNPLGRLIYSGWISQVAPFAIGSRSGVRIVCLGLISLLPLSLYKDGANFDVAQSAIDPGAIIEDIVSNFQAVYPPGSGFEWIGTDFVDGIRAGSNVDTVGTNVDFTFKKRKWAQAIEDTFFMADPGWFWFVDAGGDVFFKNKSATADHTFTIGKDAQSIDIPKSIEDIVNDVTVAYSGGEESFDDATSIVDFGLREKHIDRSADTSDAATALQIATKEVEDKKDERVEATMVINNQFDIESIRPGQTCQVLNYKKGADLFTTNMLIVSTRYRNGETIELQLETKKDFGTEITKLIDVETT